MSLSLPLVRSSASSRRLRMSGSRFSRSPMTRTRTPLLWSSARSWRMKRRSSAISSRISAGGRDQFSALNEKGVRLPMPGWPAARPGRRGAWTPRRCPPPRGRPRAAAQRPLPSMMMATCRGTAIPPIWAVRSGSVFDILIASHREDFPFLCSQHLVDLGDGFVGGLLHLLGRSFALVLADLVVLFQLLEHVEAVAADVAHGDPRGLGIFMGDLDQLLAPLLVELRDAQPQHLPFGRGIEAEIGGLNGLLHGVHHRAVPDLDGNQPRLGHAHGRELVERHVGAVGL